jgi:hypothetical protein
MPISEKKIPICDFVSTNVYNVSLRAQIKVEVTKDCEERCKYYLKILDIICFYQLGVNCTLEF